MAEQLLNRRTDACRRGPTDKCAIQRVSQRSKATRDRRCDTCQRNARATSIPGGVALVDERLALIAQRAPDVEEAPVVTLSQQRRGEEATVEDQHVKQQIYPQCPTSSFEKDTHLFDVGRSTINRWTHQRQQLQQQQPSALPTATTTHPSTRRSTASVIS